VTTATTIRCGAPTPNGPCTRKVAPGSRCGFHPDSRNDSADTEPRPAEFCGCEQGLSVLDTDTEETEIRCLKCGRPPNPETWPRDAVEQREVGSPADDSAAPRLPKRGGASEAGLPADARASAGAGVVAEAPASARLSLSTQNEEDSMSTQTVSASEELAQLQRRRDEAHQKVRAAKAERDAWADELPGLQAKLAARIEAHPEEARGDQRIARADTEAGGIRAEVGARVREENPHQAEYDEAFAPYEEIDLELQAFTRRSLPDRIRELKPDGKAAEAAIREAFEDLRAACSRYADLTEEVRALILETPGLNGQALAYDERPSIWTKVAEQALDSEIPPACLTEAAEWKVSQ